MPSFPGPDTASAHWTFDSLTDAGKLRECGRSSVYQNTRALDLTPRNLAAPAYGLGLSASGAARLRLDGVNQYADLAAAEAARFYAVAPTSGLTVGIVAKFTAPAANDIIFSCLNAGPTRGLAVRMSTADRVQVAAYDAAGAVMSATMSADGPLAGRTRVVVMQLRQSLSEARAFVDGSVIAAAFAGSALPIAYDTAILPTVGSIPGGGNYKDGDLFTVCLWPSVVGESEIMAWTRYWRDRT